MSAPVFQPDPRSQPPDNVLPFPTRRTRAPSAPPSRTRGPRAASRKITVLPVARPKPTPEPVARSREHEAHCSAGEACAAYPALGSPAKLSTHNRQQIGGKRYCYACLSRIAEERTRTVSSRQDSEAAAASRHDRGGARQGISQGARHANVARGSTAAGVGP
jgi:hypothetical protein